jgi:hypothetical protein
MLPRDGPAHSTSPCQGRPGGAIGTKCNAVAVAISHRPLCGGHFKAMDDRVWPDGARQNRPLVGRPVRLRRRAGEKGVLPRVLSSKQGTQAGSSTESTVSKHRQVHCIGRWSSTSSERPASARSSDTIRKPHDCESATEIPGREILLPSQSKPSNLDLCARLRGQGSQSPSHIP